MPWVTSSCAVTALAGLKAQKVAADLDLDNKRQILADSIGVAARQCLERGV